MTRTRTAIMPVAVAAAGVLTTAGMLTAGVQAGAAAAASPSAPVSSAPSASIAPSASVAPSPSIAPSPTGSPLSCSVTYSDFPGSPANGYFRVQITVSNNSVSAIGGYPSFGGWTLAWVFPGDQHIVNVLWGGVATQRGAQVTMTNASYDGTIPADGSVTIGFTGEYSSSDAPPTSFTLNGWSCGA